VKGPRPKYRVRRYTELIKRKNAMGEKRKHLPTEELMVEMYRRMIRIRGFELKTMQFCTEKLNRGPLHLYVGEEAAAVGACMALEKGDYITSTHRGHGHCIAMGGDVRKMLAEIAGRSTGYCKGKGGSMHIADMDLGIIGANGIVGGGIPIAVGAAVAMDNMEKKNVVLCFFGDGASNTGAFHEAMNMASIWQLPIVFICENNFYGISGCTRDTLNIENISERSKSYGIPGITVDGNDIFEVYDETKNGRERAVSGKGPTLIEMKTYRWLGHWHADPCRYRDEEEVEEWKKKCPVQRLRKHLLDHHILTEPMIRKIDEEIEVEIGEIERFALESPEPHPEEALDDVYT
jgi:TPP-dependent pyruvate/acetoin dehydrogenase alpha subunit